MNSQISNLYRIYIATLCSLSLLACKRPTTKVFPAFYHWQTKVTLDSTESVYLQNLKTKRLYTKFFDVIWDSNKNEAIPTAALQIDQATIEKIDSLNIIPTIFITNQVFKKCSVANLEELSERIWIKIQELLPNKNFVEVQFDCDWSLSTKEAYFQFLRSCRQQIPKGIKISATIRLHQYRYPDKTGVPPVDKGMLMFYNMGNLQDWEEPNSILNLEKAKPYLQKTSYDLPLDIALPLFQWGVLFREGKMIKLINGLDDQRLTDTSFYERLDVHNSPIGTSRHQVKKSTYLDGYYLYKGDLIRIEKVTPRELKSATELLKSIAFSDTTWLSFYHLDPSIVDAYQYGLLQECVEILSSQSE